MIMKIGKLDHVNVRTNRLQDMKDWYADVLGMEAGFRPDFPFDGAWLYAGDTAAVHLVDVSEEAGAGSEVPLKLEHFAFSATGSTAFEEKLKARGLDYKTFELTKINIIQFNVWDPDGNHIHVDFPIDG